MRTVFVIIMGIGLFACSAGALQRAPEPTRIAAAELPKAEGDAYRRLVGENVGLAERYEAAMFLLGSSHERDAADALAAAIAPDQPQDAWQAVLQAIVAHEGDPPKSLLPHMLQLMGRFEASLRGEYAAALSRFDDRRLERTLADVATDEDRLEGVRADAIRALGHHRTQRAAKELLGLISPDHPELIQQEAFIALTHLSGKESLGTDPLAWQAWWEQVGSLSSSRWQEHLVANFTRREAIRDAHVKQLEDRLLQSQAALVRTTSPDDRPAVLAYMLGEPLLAIRQLAMDLCRQRLIDDAAFPEPLRKALRQRMTDESPQLREQAALLLEILADEAAADQAAKLLAQGSEESKPVLRAYLRMIARMPRKAAIDPAYELLADPELRGPAAGALAAAADRKLLTRSDASRTARRVRRSLQPGDEPLPEVVTLLGKVGDDDDWGRIASWVGSADPAVKQAAAQAWADSTHSLRMLAERATDPLIQPIVIVAAAQRGSDPWTLKTLAAHPPDVEQARAAWERALIAMAGRVPPATVLETEAKLARTDGSNVLRERLLTAAIERDWPGELTPADRLALADLRLARAEIRLAQDSAASALNDFEAVAALQVNLSEADVARLLRGGTRALVRLGQYPRAISSANQLAQQTSDDGVLPAEDPLIDLLIEAARREATAKRFDMAAQVLEGVRSLLGDRIKPEVAQRIRLLEAQIEDRQKSTTNGAATATTNGNAGAANANGNAASNGNGANGANGNGNTNAGTDGNPTPGENGAGPTPNPGQANDPTPPTPAD